jgi:hypothetical protein
MILSAISPEPYLLVMYEYFRHFYLKLIYNRMLKLYKNYITIFLFNIFVLFTCSSKISKFLKNFKHFLKINNYL